MDFCSIFTIARVVMGSVKKGWKIWRVLLLEVFFIGGNLTELCLYIYTEYTHMITWNISWNLCLRLLNKKDYVTETIHKNKISTKRELSVNRKDLQAPTLARPLRTIQGDGTPSCTTTRQPTISYLIMYNNFISTCSVNFVN